MKSKIIYEKKYQHRYQEIENEAMKNVSEEQIPNLSINSDGFIHKLLENTVFVLLPERVEKIPDFVNLAIQIGDRCMADTTIVEYEDRISVTYAMHKEEPYSGLKKLVAMADELRLRNDESSIYISFDYYTYATYRAGERIFPLETA